PPTKSTAGTTPGPFARIISSSPSDGIEFRAERTYSESSHLNKEDSVAKLTRRQALAGAAANLMVLKPGIAFGSQANSAVSFGIVGTGGRGRDVGGHMGRDPRARLTAVCDLFPDRIDKAKTEIPGAAAARAYRHYEELLSQPDIDAVLIATPVFLHPEHFEAAGRRCGGRQAHAARRRKGRSVEDRSVRLPAALQSRVPCRREDPARGQDR